MKNGWKWLKPSHPKFPTAETQATSDFLVKFSKQLHWDPKTAALFHRDFVRTVLKGLMDDGFCFVPGLGYIYVNGPRPIKHGNGYRNQIKLKPSIKLNEQLTLGINELVSQGVIDRSPKLKTGQ